MRKKLIVVTFSDATMARAAITAIKELHDESGINIYAAILATRDPGGELSIEEVTKRGHGATAVGALIGGVAGFALDPIAMMLGAAGGALVGYAAEVLHEREAAEFVEKTSGNLSPGSASAVVEIAERDATEFARSMEPFGAVFNI
jgi:uncharacterized membrane protein